MKYLKLIKAQVLGVPLAWLQLTHHKGRFFATIIGVSFAVILMFIQVGFQDALYKDVITIEKTLKADLVIISTQSVSLFGTTLFPRDRLYNALEVEGIATASPFYLGSAQWKNLDNKSNRWIYLMAFNPDKPTFNLANVNQNLDVVRRSKMVLFDRLSRPEFGLIAEKIDAGKEVSTEANGIKIRVGGLFQLGGGVMSADGLLICSDLNFAHITAQSLSRINLGLLTLEPGTNLQKILNQLRNKLPEDLAVMTLQELMNLSQSNLRDNTPIGFIFGIGLLMGLFIGSVIVYQILYTDVTNHLAEYATLKALGYKDIYFLKVIWQESLFLASLGFIPGLIVSFGLYDLTRNLTRMPMAINFRQILFIFSLTLLMCFVSGIVAMNKLREADPADIF